MDRGVGRHGETPHSLKLINKNDQCKQFDRTHSITGIIVYITSTSDRWTHGWFRVSIGHRCTTMAEMAVTFTGQQTACKLLHIISLIQTLTFEKVCWFLEYSSFSVLVGAHNTGLIYFIDALRSILIGSSLIFWWGCILERIPVSQG